MLTHKAFVCWKNPRSAKSRYHNICPNYITRHRCLYKFYFCWYYWSWISCLQLEKGFIFADYEHDMDI